jgi:hypothetical protein
MEGGAAVNLQTFRIQVPLGTPVVLSQPLTVRSERGFVDACDLGRPVGHELSGVVVGVERCPADGVYVLELLTAQEAPA